MLKFLSNIFLIQNTVKRSRNEIIKKVVMQYATGNMLLKLGKFITEDKLKERKEAILNYKYL